MLAEQILRQRLAAAMPFAPGEAARPAGAEPEAGRVLGEPGRGVRCPVADIQWGGCVQPSLPSGTVFGVGRGFGPGQVLPCLRAAEVRTACNRMVNKA